MKAMILAAGRGERMGTLTKETPKVLLTVADKALIDYHLTNLAAAGVDQVVINLHYLAEHIREYLGDGANHQLTIHYSYEKTLLGLGGGVYNALPLLGDEPFILVSGDMWTDYRYADLPRDLQGTAHLVMVDNPPFHPEGDYQLQNGMILAKGKHNLNYAGFGIFRPAFFTGGGAGSYGIDKLLNIAISEGMVTGEHYHGGWANLNTPQQLAALDLTLRTKVL